MGLYKLTLGLRDSIALLAVVTTALVAPAVASGSTVSVVGVDESGGGGTLLFTAAHGERNDVVRGYLDPTVFDLGAPLTAGPGCTLLSSGGADCLSTPRHEFDLRDRDDRADISGAGALSISAGPGDDTVTSLNQSGGATVDGGPGDDTIENNADGPTLNGGAGDDHLTALGRAGARMTGGPGDDVIAAYESAWSFPGPNIIDAGAGDDVVRSWATRDPSTIDAGLGDDQITIEPVPGVPDSEYAAFSGAVFTISGGAGSDTIAGGPTRDIVDAGVGADVIDVVGGGADTVTCGVGRDTVRHDASDTVAGDCERRTRVDDPS